MRYLFLLFLAVFQPVIAHGGFGTVDEHIRAGDAHFRGLDNDQALKEYLEAERLAPNDLKVLIRLTRVYNDMGRLLLRRSPESETYYRKAISYAERMRSLYPDTAETYFWLALCHGSLVPFKSLGEKLELSRDVRANAERVIAKDSSFAMAYVILGIYYRGVARLSWAERLIVNGILGKNLEGTDKDSERMLLRARELEPENPFVHFELAATYRTMGRTEDARLALEKVASLPVNSQREALQKEQAERRLSARPNTN